MSFDLYDRVTKITGDYSFDGKVVSSLEKLDGKQRYVVEDDRGALHIYSEQNLRQIGNMADHQYLRILKKLLTKGVYREGRNGHGTYGLFGEQMRFDLSEGFPLLTTKKIHFHSVLVELLWFLRGDTNIKFLKDHNVRIWDEWADENGDLGPVYGAQWRSWNVSPLIKIDQIKNVIAALKKDPYSRRHIVSAWNPAEIENMALPPCHTMFQFHVAEGRLSCQLYQRSGDWLLGIPFNVASYALLTILMAKEVGLEPGDFVHTVGDLHLYDNHVEQAKEQLSRQPRSLPTIKIFQDQPTDIFGYQPNEIQLIGYDPHPAIKAQVAV